MTKNLANGAHRDIVPGMAKIGFIFNILLASVFIASVTLSAFGKTEFQDSEPKRNGNPRVPIFLLGDWSSSGGASMPYKPENEPDYRCQAQLTDGLSIVSESNQHYVIYAVAEFLLSEYSQSVRSESLRWYTKRVYSPTHIEDTLESPVFQLDGHRFHRHFLKNEPLDLMIFGIGLQQPIHGILIKQNSEMKLSIPNPEFQATAPIQIQSQDGALLPQYAMRVICSRKYF